MIWDLAATIYTVPSGGGVNRARRRVTAILFICVPRGRARRCGARTQTVMPYPVDHYRFTAEGAEMLLKDAGFQARLRRRAGQLCGLWAVGDGRTLTRALGCGCVQGKVWDVWPGG